MTIYTIGVYGSTEQEFFDKLVENRIDIFYDIRRHRGVRGRKYSFVNSKRLQTRLGELGIKYRHVLELSPTNEIREKQKVDDLIKGEYKRDRNTLGQVFVNEFNTQIIDQFDFDAFLKKPEETGANRVVLFCVESKAEACHRSIVANELHKHYNYEIINL